MPTAKGTAWPGPARRPWHRAPPLQWTRWQRYLQIPPHRRAAPGRASRTTNRQHPSAARKHGEDSWELVEEEEAGGERLFI